MQGVANPPYQAGPPGPGSHGAVPSQLGVHPGHKLPQVVTPTPPFVPSTGPGFLQKPGMAPMQPPSPVQPSQSQSVVAPPAPPPTVQAVDTSNVPGNIKFPLDVQFLWSWFTWIQTLKQRVLKSLHSRTNIMVQAIILLCFVVFFFF